MGINIAIVDNKELAEAFFGNYINNQLVLRVMSAELQ